MKTNTPDWLNEEFFATILHELEKTPRVRIVKLAVKYIDAANFASDVLQASVNYEVEDLDEEKSVNLIVKLPIYTGRYKELSDRYNFFRTEPLLYNSLLPKMHKKLKTEIAPKSYKCPIADVLVLKDMTPDGYIVTKRYEQYDFAHSKSIVEVLAKYHAGSVACYREDPVLVEMIGKEKLYIMEGSFRERLEHWMKEDFKQCAKTMLEMGVDKETTDFIFSKADETLWERISKLNEPNPKMLNVLNHGDVWTNNVLFKYGIHGEISDVKLIDFQLGKYGPPVLDLIYFIWSHVNEEVRETRLPELYKTYLKHLNKTLGQLGCSERMTYQQLESDLKSYIDWTLVIVCFVLTFLMCEPEDFIDEGTLTMDQLLTIENDPRFPKYFTNKNIKPLLPGIARQIKAFYLHD